ncbi:MAG: hypothetical protein ACYST3_08570, partial [Planctomycetota bacterium]
LLGFSCTDRLNDVINPSIGLMMAQFKARDKLADPRYFWADGGNIILHPIDVLNFGICLQGAITPP